MTSLYARSLQGATIHGRWLENVSWWRHVALPVLLCGFLMPDAFAQIDKRDIDPALMRESVEKNRSVLIPQLKSSPILRAARERLRTAVANGLRGDQLIPLGIEGVVATNEHAEIQCYIFVDQITPAVLQAIDVRGCRRELTSQRGGMVQGWLTVDGIDQISALPFVRRITSPDYVVTRCAGTVYTEGDTIHRADEVRAEGIDGTGVSVGVISNGVDNRATAIASGDLPPSITIHPALGGEGDEGTAILEIIHDLAPGASLFFAGPTTSLEFATAIDWMVAQGVHVIVDDLGVFGEPFFEDGIVASAAKNAVNAGHVYCSAAGNDCQQHYQGIFTPVTGSTFHDFKLGPAFDDALDAIVSPGASILVVLQWDDAFGASGNDYDLGLFDFTSESFLAVSIEIQNGNDDPIEALVWENTFAGDRHVGIVVDNFEGVAATREIELFVLNADLFDDDRTCADSVFGHPAVEEVISCAAIRASDPGLDDIEFFSSQGPSTIRFPFSESRQTPFAAAVNGISVTGAGGFPSPFFGTSAAAPHAAGIAALLLDAVDAAATPAQIRSALAAGAADRGPAGFDNVFGHGILDARAALDEICAQLGCASITEQCCFPDGSCQDLATSDCTGQSGISQGGGTDCLTGPMCTKPTGACCFDDGNCQVLTVTECANQSGAYEGNGTDCTPNLCPQPTGACCFEDGSCQELTATDCANQSGAYEGDDTDCTPNPCPQPTGACCFDAGSCQVLTATDCANQSGAYAGDGTDCVPNPCPQPTGACCFDDGSCQVLTATDCANQSGAYEGNGTDCASNPCPQPMGACCFNDGSCQLLTATECTNQSGAYDGDGTDCTPNPCPQPTGACCFDDGSCQVLTATECTNQSGAYDGDGTDCTPNPCPQPTGACCFADGSCQVLTATDCTNQSGAYEGDGTDCTPNPCPQPTGACCFDDGSCQVLTAADCTNQVGAYEGDDTVCAPNPCPQPTQQCCFPDGSCQDLTFDECANSNGFAQGFGTNCATGISCGGDCGDGICQLGEDVCNCEDCTDQDSDGDGILDPIDNCIDDPNPGQDDTDCDGIGNVCDADNDNDGDVDAADMADLIRRFGSSDPLDDSCDLNFDGVVGMPDLLRLLELFGHPPGPSCHLSCD